MSVCLSVSVVTFIAQVARQVLTHVRAKGAPAFLSVESCLLVFHLSQCKGIHSVVSWVPATASVLAGPAKTRFRVGSPPSGMRCGVV
jgi:hypothetical protein